MRPATLVDVAKQAGAGHPFDMCLANFLDGFYAQPSESAIESVPELLAPQYGEMGRVQDAYLAAVAEDLAQRYSLPLPSWVRGEDRELRRPWFTSQLASRRAILILESPPAFRSRNLFVSENALSRA